MRTRSRFGLLTRKEIEGESYQGQESKPWCAGNGREGLGSGLSAKTWAGCREARRDGVEARKERCVWGRGGKLTPLSLKGPGEGAVSRKWIPRTLQKDSLMGAKDACIQPVATSQKIPPSLSSLLMSPARALLPTG